MANILVTGGAGYIGSHVCKALAVRGHTPVAYDNLSRGYEMLVRWGPLERGDVNDAARLKAVFAQYQPAAVIHLAGYAFVNESVANPALYHTNNVVGTLTLLSAMRDAGIDRIVASSSCSVYASAPTPLDEASAVAPASPYAASKVTMEQALAKADGDYGLRWVALRYFNAAGADPEGEAGEITTAGVRVIPNLFDTALGLRPVFQINGDDYATPDGTCVRDYTHVCDIADAHLQALAYLEEGPQRIFNLGNGQGHSIRSMVAAVEAVTGHALPIEIAPRRPGDPACLVADAGRATRSLPWTPRYPALTDMIAHAWAWHRNIPENLRAAAGS
jgi:UDP-arabinose 4-epimerase